MDGAGEGPDEGALEVVGDLVNDDPYNPPPMLIPAETICNPPETTPPASASLALVRRSSAMACICWAIASICITRASRAARASSESINNISAAMRA